MTVKTLPKEETQDNTVNFSFNCTPQEEDAIRIMGRNICGNNGKSNAIIAILTRLIDGDFPTLQRAYNKYLKDLNKDGA